MRQLIGVFIFSIMFSMISHAGQWQQDLNGWRYQNDDGTFNTGWYQDADGKWYYFDEQSGYMLANTVTPDGYTVASDGTWSEKTEMTKNDSGYDNKIELEGTAYDDGPGGIKQLEHAMPITVYYNDRYKNIFSGNVEVSRVELSSEGIPCMIYVVDSYDLYELSVKYKYILEDGTYLEGKSWVSANDVVVGEKISSSILNGWIHVRKNQKVVALEIRIDESEK